MLVQLGLVILGVAVGMVSGLLGIGGGILLVPGLMLFFGYSQSQAQGTSLAVLIPPVGIFAAWEYYRQGQVELPAVVLMALGFCAGAWLGARAVPVVPQDALRLAFGCLLLYVGWHFLIGPKETPPIRAASAAGLTAASSGAAALIRRRRRGPNQSP